MNNTVYKTVRGSQGVDYRQTHGDVIVIVEFLLSFPLSCSLSPVRLFLFADSSRRGVERRRRTRNEGDRWLSVLCSAQGRHQRPGGLTSLLNGETALSSSGRSWSRISVPFLGSVGRYCVFSSPLAGYNLNSIQTIAPGIECGQARSLGALRSPDVQIFFSARPNTPSAGLVRVTEDESTHSRPIPLDDNPGYEPRSPR